MASARSRSNLQPQQWRSQQWPGLDVDLNHGHGPRSEGVAKV